MEKLTNKQENVLKELKKYMAKKGYPPTVRELCKATNLNSTATVQTHLNTLVQKGFITKDPEKNRTIELQRMEVNASAMNMQKRMKLLYLFPYLEK